MLPRVENHYKNLLEGKQKRIDQLSIIKNELTSKNKNLQQFSDEFRKKFETEFQKNCIASEQIELLKDAKNQLMERLQKTTNDCKIFAQEIVTVTQSRDEWRQQAELLQREKCELERYLSEMKRNALMAHQHFSNQIELLSNEKENLKQELNQVSIELQKEREASSQMRITNSNIQSQNEGYHQEITQLKGELEKSKHSQLELKNQLANITQERIHLSEQLNNVSNDTNRLDGERSVLSQKVKAFQLEISQLQERCRSNESELLCSRAEIQETRSKLQLLESHNQMLVQQIEIAKSEQSNMDKILSDSRQALLETQSEFELHKSEHKSTLERMDLIHNRLKEKTNAYLELMKERNQLVSTVEDLQFLEEINNMQQQRISWLENEMKTIEETSHTRDIQNMVGGVCSQEEAIAMARHYETQIQKLKSQLQVQEMEHKKELEELRNSPEDTLMDITNTSQPMDKSMLYSASKLGHPLRTSFFSNEIM